MVYKLRYKNEKSEIFEARYFENYSFSAEKELVDGYFSNTLHEDELTNGLRQRLRVSGAIEDRSKGIGKILFITPKAN